MISVTATHAPKSSAYCCPCGSRPSAASTHSPTPALDAHQQGMLTRSRRKSSVHDAAEALQVEQHVDGDDEQQHDREERLADRDRRALDERDDLVRVLADVALPDLFHEPMA